MLLGLDFDNTLIRYDELFHKIALEKGLIPKSLTVEKNAVRDYLRELDQEDEWTRMQGEVYGRRITEALPFEGMLETLLSLRKSGIAMCLVSHKTRTPYLGGNYDLHRAARNWLNQQKFFADHFINWRADQIFFELTKQKKVERIISLGCTHYVDDLPEILELLPSEITKILFNPNNGNGQQNQWIVMHSWKELPKLLL